MGTGSFPGVKSGRGVTLTPYPLLVPWSWKARAIPLLPLWAIRPVQSLSACTGMHFTFTFTTLWDRMYHRRFSRRLGISLPVGRNWARLNRTFVLRLWTDPGRESRFIICNTGRQTKSINKVIPNAKHYRQNPRELLHCFTRMFGSDCLRFLTRSSTDASRRFFQYLLANDRIYMSSNRLRWLTTCWAIWNGMLFSSRVW